MGPISLERAEEEEEEDTFPLSLYVAATPLSSAGAGGCSIEKNIGRERALGHLFLRL